MKTTIRLFFLSILFFATTTMVASNTDPKEKIIMFSGKVVDVSQNELLAGVSIQVTNCEKIIYTDLNGNFFIYIKVNPSDDFKIEFSQVGYISKTITSTDIEGSLSHLEINLTEE